MTRLLRFCAAIPLVLALALGPAKAATLDQMAGQMIIVGFQGDDASDASVIAMRDAIAEGRIGGVMYLKINVASLEAVRAMNTAFREASPDLPPFITLDQEGGAVERLTADVGFAEIPNAETVARNNTPEQAQALYDDLAARIADLGFTVNFGPVADLNINPNNQIIARFGRAFSADPTIVTNYDAHFIQAHWAHNLWTALKHFPGHGSSTADSHEGFVDISDTWKPEELEPYRRLIASGYNDFIMVGHLYHRDYSEGDDRIPSSLSHRWVTDVLRNELGFEGVTISDDLEMGAIRDHFSLRETVTRAVRAGLDVLLFSNTAAYHLGLADEIRAILVSEAEADPAFAARIEESYNRITALKNRHRP
jgi:beta-N-acetylhexosaminidase